MTETFITPENRSTLFWLQLYFGIVGLLLFIIGLGRISLEFLGDASRNLITEQFPFLDGVQGLSVGVLFVLAGYYTLYSFAAVGSQDPPANRAMLVSFIVIPITILASGIILATTTLVYGLIFIVLGALLGGASYWLWGQAQANQLWKVFGEQINRQQHINPLVYIVAIVGVILLIALGVIYGILSNRIELPPSDVESGELLYTTSFDSYNDEWDLPRGRQSAEIIDGELVLTEGTGISDAVFYARLDSRRFSDFDLRVKTHQLGGDIDNSYGVIFRWRDFGNFYRFEISGDGFYRLSKTEENFTESLTPWMESGLIYQGETENEIRIIAQDDTFTFWINGQQVPLCTKGDARQPTMNPLTGECISNDLQTDYTDSDFRQGKIGLTVGTTQTTDVSSPVKIGFDNLILVGP